MSRNNRSRYSQVRLRLTRPGWVVAFLAVFLLLASVRTQQSMVFVILGAFAGALVASGILASRMVKGASVHRDAPDRIWQNQPVHLGYFVHNERRRGSALGLGVEEVTPEGLAAAEGFCVHLPPRATFRAGARFAAKRRGRLVLHGVRVKTVFPFGLIAAGRDSPLHREIIVWPERGRLKTNLLHRGATQTSAKPPSRSSGGQDEFFGLREYRQGDSPRWIHWRRSASRRVPVVREMAQPLPELLWVVLDTQRETYDDDARARAERNLRFCATLVEQAFARGYQVGLAMGMSTGPLIITPASGRGQRRRVLDALAGADENTTTELRSVIGGLDPRGIRNARVVAVTRTSDGIISGGQTLRYAREGLTVLPEEQLDEVYADQHRPEEG
ncbi:MAG: DUF58 domain-containing protein [Planctomycetota bacterium]